MSFQRWFYCVITNSFLGFWAKAIALDEHLSPVLRISFLRERYYLSKIWALSPFWSVLFLCIFPFFTLSSTLPLCAPSYFIFLYLIFDVSLPLCYLCYLGFPPLGLCLRVMEVRIVLRFFFPYTPWAGILRKVPFPPPLPLLPPYFICSFFFLFFFLFFKQLNWIMFALRIFASCFFLPLFLVKTDCRLVQHAFFRAPQRLSILNSFDRMQ